MSRIIITELDKKRLMKLIDDVLLTDLDNQPAKALLKEVERAQVVAPRAVPSDVITMNSKAQVLLDGEQEELTLAYPPEADPRRLVLSVLSPIGTALLGFREGDEIEWSIPSGISKIRIEKILFQPEAAGEDGL